MNAEEIKHTPDGCTLCGYAHEAHRVTDNACPIINRTWSPNNRFTPRPDPAADRLARNEGVKKRAEAMTPDGNNEWFIDSDCRAWRVTFASGAELFWPPLFNCMKSEDYQLTPVPTAEQNAATRKVWEAMKETDDKAFRLDKDGRKCRVEYFNVTDSSPKWLPNDNHMRDDNGWGAPEIYLNRITPIPAPTVEPWTIADHPQGAVWIRRKGGENQYLIFEWDKHGFEIMHHSIGYKDALNLWEQTSGAACGRLAATEKGAK